MLAQSQHQLAQGITNSGATNPVHGYVASAKSPAIQRLIEEVRNKEGQCSVGGKYDRTHNRHNRGK